MRSISFRLEQLIANVLAPVDSFAALGDRECGSDVRRAIVPVFRDLLAKGSVLRLRLDTGARLFFSGTREILTVRRVPAESIHLGDLIFIEPVPGAAVLQRVVGKTGFPGSARLRTLGEAPASDGFSVNCDRVLGKVLAVEAAAVDGTMRMMDLESLRWRLSGCYAALRLLWATHLQRQTRKIADPECAVAGTPVRDAARESA